MKKILLIALFSSSLFFISTEVNAADNREDISIGKGKKTFDLREDIKQRDWKREKARVLKNSSKAK